MKKNIRIENSLALTLAWTALFFFISGAAFAGSLKEIQLSDGSVIKGEIVSYANGVYHIKSDALGTFNLEDARVVSITSLAEEPSNAIANIASTETVYSNGIDLEMQTGEIAGQMLNDPETWRLIQKLQNDPSMMKILNEFLFSLRIRN